MSPTFVTNETEDEDVLFVSWGDIKPGQDKAKSLLVKEKESVTGIVTDISDSTTYKKIYRLKVDGEEKTVVVLGKTDLNNKMGYGTKKASTQVQVNDLIQITYEGKKKTGKGRPFYQFTVGIAKKK